jgi:ADP-ribose pyrophosphatase
MYEKTVSSQIIHRGKFLDFKEDIIEIQTPGETVHGVRQYMIHPGGVCIIPVLDNGKIILEKQFRKPLDKYIFEIPAGKIDPGEIDKLETAKRELQEETGYTAKNWTYLGEIYPCPGYSTEVLYIYLAKNLVAGNQSLDYGEFIELEYLSLEEIDNKISSGEIPDSKTISSIYLYKLKILIT